MFDSWLSKLMTEAFSGGDDGDGDDEGGNHDNDRRF